MNERSNVIILPIHDKSKCPFCKSDVAEVNSGINERATGTYECGVDIASPYPTEKCIEALHIDIQFWKSIHHDDVENPYRNLA